MQRKSERGGVREREDRRKGINGGKREGDTREQGHREGGWREMRDRTKSHTMQHSEKVSKESRVLGEEMKKVSVRNRGGNGKGERGEGLRRRLREVREEGK